MDDEKFVSAQEMYEQFKIETAGQLGIDLKSKSLTSKEAGKVGAQMMKRYRQLLFSDN